MKQPSQPQDALSRLAAAMTAYAEFLERPGEVTAESRARWLEAHGGLADLLDPLSAAPPQPTADSRQDAENPSRSAAAVSWSLPPGPFFARDEATGRWRLSADRSTCAGATAVAATGGFPPHLPSEIGGHVLLEELGHGASGTVWRARDPRLGRDVALKLFDIRRLRDSSVRQRMHREASAASRLDHPNLCKVFAFDGEGAQPWLAMQLVRGETLRARLERRAGKPTAPDTAQMHADVALLETLAHALHHAHERGFVHRDVKPGNIMITDRGEPVLLDFGLVRDDDSAQQLTHSGDLMGTPAYMAPEQVAGGPATRRFDIWALGVILYECVVGTRPFDAPTRLGVLQAIQNGAWRGVQKARPCVPRDLAMVIETALHASPERSYATAADLAEDLRRWRCREPVRARQPTVAARARLWCERHPLPAGLIAALLTSLLGITWLLLHASTIAAKEVSARTRAEANEAQLAFDAAQEAASRGNWAHAESLYARAEALQHDRVLVALGRIDMWNATFQTKRANAALEQLGNGSGLGRHEAMVTLLLNDTTRLELGSQPRKRWRAAIEGIVDSPDLTPAWQHYARAVIAETVPSLLHHLTEALRADRRHRMANELLGPVTLFVRGPAAALQVARESNALYPDDPAVVLLEATSLSLLGRTAEAEARMDAINLAKTARNQVKVLVEARDAIRAAVKSTFEKLFSPPAGSLLDSAADTVWNLLALFQNLSFLRRDSDVMFRFPDALLSSVGASVMSMMSAFRDKEAAQQALDRAAAIAPTLTCLMARVLVLNHRGDLEGAVTAFEQAMAAGDDFCGTKEVYQVVGVAIAAKWHAQVVQARKDPTTARVAVESAIERCLQSNGLESTFFKILTYSAAAIRNQRLAQECGVRWLRQYPDDPRPVISYVNACAYLEQLDLVRAELNSASRRWPNEPSIRDAIDKLKKREAEGQRAPTGQK